MSRSLYVKLEVDYADNPRIAQAGEAAEIAYIRILCLCKKTHSDGLVTQEQLKRLGLPRLGQRLKRLCEVGVLEQRGRDFVVTGWLQRNVSRVTLDRISTEKRHSGRIGGHRSAQVRWGAEPSESKQSAYTEDKHYKEKDKDKEKELPCSLPAASKPERASDPLFETVAEVCEIDWHNLTRSARGSLGKAVAELRQAGATPDEVLVRSRRYREEWPDAELTPLALAKHWPRFAAPRKRTPAPSSNLQAVSRVATMLTSTSLLNGNGSHANGTH